METEKLIWEYAFLAGQASVVALETMTAFKNADLDNQDLDLLKKYGTKMMEDIGLINKMA